ncbi:MAG: LEA type 2 family protein [Steroidobacteraceae bacterium]
MNGRRSLIALFAIGVLLFQACANLQGKDPLQVTVAGIEPLQGEGMELRLMVKLRVQNPNEAAIDYDGIGLQMDVQGKAFASGVSDASGSIPRFGESVVEVPVTISAFRMARQALGMATGNSNGKLTYEMKGKLGGSILGTTRFTTKGEFDVPTGIDGPSTTQ